MLVRPTAKLRTRIRNPRIAGKVSFSSRDVVFVRQYQTRPSSIPSSDSIILPIRPINFPFPEFQAAGRAQHLTPTVAEYPPVPLTGVSGDAGFPLQQPA